MGTGATMPQTRKAGYSKVLRAYLVPDPRSAGEFPDNKFCGAIRARKKATGGQCLIGRCAYEIDRVYTTAILQHLEMQVRACGAARVAHVCDRLAFFDLVSD